MKLLQFFYDFLRTFFARPRTVRWRRWCRTDFAGGERNCRASGLSSSSKEIVVCLPGRLAKSPSCLATMLRRRCNEQCSQEVVSEVVGFGCCGSCESGDHQD